MIQTDVWVMPLNALKNQLSWIHIFKARYIKILKCDGPMYFYTITFSITGFGTITHFLSNAIKVIIILVILAFDVGILYVSWVYTTVLSCQVCFDLFAILFAQNITVEQVLNTLSRKRVMKKSVDNDISLSSIVRFWFYEIYHHILSWTHA